MYRKRVDELYAQIKAANEELVTIREKCAHPEYRVGWFSWRIACMDPKRLCTECDEVLDGITEEEAKKLRDELYKSKSECILKHENEENSIHPNI